MTPIGRMDECEACSRYRRRNGVGRPDHLIRRALDRRMERAATRLEQSINGTETRSPCSLYRVYDANGQLLYVGITETGVSRFDSHRLHAKWWHQASRIELDHYPDRTIARSVEQACIDTWKPPYNLTR